MTEQFCDVGDIRLCYETFGEPGDPALLLVMGLGTQMVGWPDGFCELLASRDFFVIRFDNRDIGKSTKINAPVPTVGQLMRRSQAGATYSLRDMAGDAIGLLDHLGVRGAHVVGASMGGMIAQEIAIGYPDRVLSLVSIMSNTGSRVSGQPAPGLYPVLLRRRAVENDRAVYVERMLAMFKTFGSRGELEDDDTLRDVLGKGFDRDRDVAGGARQLAAIVTSGERSRALRGVRVPAVVIHGTVDRLVRPSGARATAKAIPGAKLVMIENMGHDLPRGIWARVADEIVENAARAKKLQPVSP